MVVSKILNIYAIIRDYRMPAMQNQGSLYAFPSGFDVSSVFYSPLPLPLRRAQVPLTNTLPRLGFASEFGKVHHFTPYLTSLPFVIIADISTSASHIVFFPFAFPTISSLVFSYDHITRLEGETRSYT